MDKRIGAQLYSVKELCTTKEGFEDTMKKLAEVGFKTVQLSGLTQVWDDVDYVKAVFDNYGLQCVATHFPIERYEEDIEAMVRYHKKLNCGVAGIGSVFPDLRKDYETLRNTIAKCNGFHERLMQDGIKFGWHNHAFEFAKLDENTKVMDVLLEEGNFTFILDTYWLAFVGVDPAKFLRNHADRVSILHYKDIRALTTNAVEYAEVGSGNIDWAEVVAASVKPDFAVIEQENCVDPIASLGQSYRYLTTNFDFI